MTLFDVDPVAEHPCEYSPELIPIIGARIRDASHVHDCFAGMGLHLGRLCDLLGIAFTGTDIEDWPGHDPRVTRGDARDRSSYPPGRFTLCCSPVYLNKRLADYANGATPTTNIEGRRDYAIALGRALHPDNLARATGRPSRAAAYWAGHAAAVQHWGERALVNVDEPISEPWQDLLADHGYTIVEVIPVETKRFRGLANDDKRAEHEVVIVAERLGVTP